MRFLDGELILSPSDLTGFAACEHLTQLDLRVARGELEKPDREDPLVDVLKARGEEHEAAVLAAAEEEARAAGGSCAVTELPGVVAIPDTGWSRDELTARAAQTVAAMRDGAAVVYQAVFFDGRWQGYADFLLRVDTPSALGPWSYEVADAKLARSVKAAAVLQCCAYTEWVAAIQGLEPEHLHVITSTRSASPTSPPTTAVSRPTSRPRSADRPAWWARRPPPTRIRSSTATSAGGQVSATHSAAPTTTSASSRGAAARRPAG